MIIRQRFCSGFDYIMSACYHLYILWEDLEAVWFDETVYFDGRLSGFNHRCVIVRLCQRNKIRKNFI